VAFDPIAVVVTGAREADQFPSDHVAVTAIDWVREETLLCVLQQQVEELLAVDILERDRSAFKASQHLVLVRRYEFTK
jgi:hypothetical protein